MRLLAAALLFGVTFSLAAACSGKSDEAKARDALPLMTLQADQVPEGLVRAEQKFSTNEELAQSQLGAPPEERELEAWGRILGYETDFQAAQIGAGPVVSGVDSAVSLYKTADGTSLSFADISADAREANWQSALYSDLSKFQQDEIQSEVPADEIFWLRLSGMRQGVLVVDYQIVVRVDRVRSYLRVLISEDGGQDRTASDAAVEALLRQQITNIRNTLDSGVLD